MIVWIQHLFYLALLLNSTILLPQIIKIFKTKNVKNLSIISFLGFLFMQIITLLHAIFHQDIALAIGMALSSATTGTLIVQIIIYAILYKKQMIK